MVANFDSKIDYGNALCDIASRLIGGLDPIPADWALTPVLEDKRPYRTNWQKETALTRENLIATIHDGDSITRKNGSISKIYPQGYGLRTGKVSGGILSIDVDGPAAQDKLTELGELPKTISFTSGKTGRCQYLLRLPEQYWEVFKTFKINTKVKGEDGKEQQLEFRWDGCQSVLPPSVHPETGFYKWVNSPQDCQIAECPPWVIKLFLNEHSALNNQQSPENSHHSPITNYQLPITNYPISDIPLYQCLTKDDRNLIDHGAREGERNDKGAKLARNLIGTANRLVYLGHSFEGEPRSLFDDYCCRCSPPLNSREADTIWKSATKDNPTATLTDDVIENCVKAWHKNQGVKARNACSSDSLSPQSPIKNNVVPHPTKTQEELLKQIDLLISRDLPRSELEAIIPDIAKQYNRHSADIWKLYNARVKEQEKLEDRKETTKQLPTLLDAQKSRLDPYELFWSDRGQFAHTLMGIAENMPTAVEHLITTLIAAAGSRIGTSSKIVINPSAKYTQPAIFWTCIVAGTGQLKTPAQQAILSPLYKLEAEEHKNWKLENDNYKKSLVAYKKSKDQDAETPEPPAPRKRLIVSSATSEARIKLHGENPRGFLNYRDEWSGFISGRNKYRKGAGDDLEQDLSEFNGNALMKDLVKAEDSVFLEKSAISRTGNTQPETLKKLQSANNFEDFQGEISRWLFCLVNSKPAFINLFRGDDGLGDTLDNRLINLYRRLGELPERDYFLDLKAKQCFQDYQHQLKKWELEENHPGLRASYPKFESYLARLALFLHLVNAALVGATPEQMISEYTMLTACKMIDFYLAQARLVYALNSPQQELAGNYLKVKQFIDKRGQVTVRDIKCGVAAMKILPSADIASICDELVSQGVVIKREKFYTSLSKDDNVDEVLMKYTNFKNAQNTYSTSNSAVTKNSNVDNVDTLLMDYQHTESLINQGFQKMAVDNVDDFSSFYQHSEKSAVDAIRLAIVDGVDGVDVDKLEKYINKMDNQTPETFTQYGVDTVDGVSTTINNLDQSISEKLTSQGLTIVDGVSTEHQQPSTSSTSSTISTVENVKDSDRPLTPQSSTILLSDLKPGDKIESDLLPLGMGGWGIVDRIEDGKVHIQLAAKPIPLDSIKTINGYGVG